jgi:hypothetical protein
VLACLLGQAPAAEPAPEAHVRLRVHTAVSGCPAEPGLEDSVAARLGYRPFFGDAPDVVEVEVTQDGGQIRARVERFDPQGLSLGRRLLASSTCAELGPAIELALSITIDPLSLTRPPAPPPAPPPKPPGPPIDFVATLGGMGAGGFVPSLTGGPVIGAELRWPRFSIGLEGQDALPTTMPVGSGSAQVGVLTVGALPCLRLSWFGACAVVEAGATQVNGVQLQDAGHETTPFVAVGGRVLGDVHIWGPLGLRLQVDLLAPVSHTTVQAGSSDLWTTPSVAADAGLLLAVRL